VTSTRTCSHWSNEDTTRDYIEEIILLYINKKRNELTLADNHQVLMIFANFKDQCTETILKLLDANYISVVMIPPNHLQPLNISVNKATLFARLYSTKAGTLGPTAYSKMSSDKKDAGKRKIHDCA